MRKYNIRCGTLCKYLPVNDFKSYNISPLKPLTVCSVEFIFGDMSTPRQRHYFIRWLLPVPAPCPKTHYRPNPLGGFQGFRRHAAVCFYRKKKKFVSSRPRVRGGWVVSPYWPTHIAVSTRKTVWNFAANLHQSYQYWFLMTHLMAETFWERPRVYLNVHKL